MLLESHIRNKRAEKEILLMTHIVLGYPTFEKSFRVVEAMVDAGVDLMELQIPFSEPVADGPVISRANQEALAGGSTVQKCLDFSEEIARTFKIPFLIMSYYNILFKYGVNRFVSAMARKGLKGAIVPDLPPEEGKEYLKAMGIYDLAPIFIYSPTTPDDRMKFIASLSRGFIYCVARKGVTGTTTTFTNDVANYVDRCRKASPLPLALGFGVKGKEDVDFLRGRVDIAVIGSQTISILDEEGISPAVDFIRGLRRGK